MVHLKTILLINALSSAATGVLLVLFSGPVASLFDVETRTPFTEVGLFLVIFGSYVLWIATRQAIQAKALSFIIGLDIAWVVASLLTVLAGASALSWVGHLAIIAVAGWVGLMAYLQHKGRGSAHGSARAVE